MTERTCSVDGCERPLRARGFCKSHYTAWRGRVRVVDAPSLQSCSVERCDRAACTRGLCGMHYARWRLTGTTDKRVRTTEDRFWAKVERSGSDECWCWQAAASDRGYGTFYSGSRLIQAHRWAYEHLVGPIPAGLHLDHLCEHPWCVNPAHLEPVTIQENSCRQAARRRERTATCPQGHLFDEQNTFYAQGARRCRECARERGRRRYHEVRKSPDRYMSIGWLRERDGDTCALCGLAVTAETASIDHIVPLSRGGPHTEENVQLAHRRCNTSKGNRLSL